MINEKKFSFLEKSEFFKDKFLSYAGIVYDYSEKKRDKVYEGRITFYIGKAYVGEKYVGWEFKSNDENFDVKYKRIEVTPEWFQELYRKASRKYDELTRVRRLFEVEGDE